MARNPNKTLIMARNPNKKQVGVKNQAVYSYPPCPPEALGHLVNTKHLNNNSKNKIMKLFGVLEGKKAAIDGLSVDNNAFGQGMVRYDNRELAKYNAEATIRSVAQRVNQGYNKRDDADLFEQLEAQGYQEPQIQYQVQQPVIIQQPQPQIQQQISNTNIMDKPSTTIQNTQIDGFSKICNSIDKLTVKLDTLCKIIGYAVKLQNNSPQQNNPQIDMNTIEDLISKKVAEAVNSLYGNEEFDDTLPEDFNDNNEQSTVTE